MGITFSQFFPPKPTLTEANLPSQKGKVFVVTGGYSGLGLQLCIMLYQAGGKVYVAGRSKEKAQSAISNVKALPTASPGELIFLPISLDDLKTIKPAVEAFTSSEERLDVLFNNAGVLNPPLFTQLLIPIMRRTAHTVPSASVRVVWTSSMAVDLTAPKDGMNISDVENPPRDQRLNYLNSKLGNWFLASALATQVGSDGILSLTQNPGNLKTPLLRHLPRFVGFITAPLLYNARMGAYTELWAGLASDLTIEDGGKYVLPWGRLHPSPRPELLAAMNSKEEGGTGVEESFVNFCRKHTAEFV